MTALRVAWSRLWAMFAGGRRQRALDEEIETHLEFLAEEHIRAGMSPDAARAAARRSFGGVDRTKEAYRDQRVVSWMAALIQDVRFGARLLLKEPRFAAAAIVVLGLGIGASNTVFTILDGLFFRPMPIEDPEHVVLLRTIDARGRGRAVSYLDYQDWRASTRAFTEIAATGDASMNVSEDGRVPERLFGTYVSANLFRLIGRHPVLGREFRAEDDQAGAAPVVILGYSVWTSRYGQDRTVIGRVVRVNGLATTIVGVMPEGFRFPAVADVWQPLALRPALAEQPRDARNLFVYGRLASGVTIPQGGADLAGIAERLGHDFPQTNNGVRPVILTLSEFAMGQLAPVAAAFVTAVGFVLLIACANVANLLLARSARRSREIAIRASLGATRWRLVRQLLVEGLLVSAMACGLGMGLSVVGVRLFVARFYESMEMINGAGVPYWVQFTFDARVVVFLITICVITAVLSALPPALQATKRTATEAGKDGGRVMTAGISARRLTTALLILQFTLTLTLCAGAGLMMRSLMALNRADRALDTSRLLTLALALPKDQYASVDARTLFLTRLEDRLSATGGVESATSASSPPFINALLRAVEIDRPSPLPPDVPSRVSVVAIGGRYFDTLGLRPVRGRVFTPADGMRGSEGAIVNQRFVELYLGGADPIARRVRVSTSFIDTPRPDAPWFTIVGVTPTVRQQNSAAMAISSNQDADPVLYIPSRLDADTSTGATPSFLIVRAAGDAGAAVSGVREAVQSLDRDLPVFDIRTMDQLASGSTWAHQILGGTFAIFACLALVLATVGLYAVTAYAVAQRTREIGVRVALGAGRRQVCWLILRRGLAQLGIGMLIGLAGALGVGRVLGSLMIHTSPNDPLTLVSITAGLAIIATTACFIPARRAARLDPAVTLRYE